MGVMLFIAPTYWPASRATTYVAMLALLVAELAVIGWVITGRPSGVFIDNRNRISLSRLQASAWTIVILAAFATAAAYNAAVAVFEGGVVSSLAITIPSELLLAMGMSATSLVATPALLSIKTQQTPQKDAEAKAQVRVAAPITSDGNLLKKTALPGASWDDIVTGEELGNAGTADLGKIQQLLISLLLLGSYAAYVYAQFSGSSERITDLPGLDKSFVWLLGISHASYLAYKAAPHSPSDRSGITAAPADPAASAAAVG
jgi:hypothetical protein